MSWVITLLSSVELLLKSQLRLLHCNFDLCDFLPFQPEKSHCCFTFLFNIFYKCQFYFSLTAGFYIKWISSWRNILVILLRIDRPQVSSAAMVWFYSRAAMYSRFKAWGK